MQSTAGFILPALVGIYGTRLKTQGRVLLAVGILFGMSSFTATMYGMLAHTQDMLERSVH
jgi:hypothetical protein